MEIKPISLKAANAFVEQHHRHHGPTRGHKFSIAVEVDNQIVGVAIAGRPVARNLDDGQTLKVTRVCTLGHENTCSKLLSAIVKAGRAMGYSKIITYTLESESGVSLRAAGFMNEGLCRGGSWNRPSRNREDKAPLDHKVRWSRELPLTRARN